MALIVLFTLLLVIIYFCRYMRKNYSIFEEINIPHPKPIWIFGNLREFKDRNPLHVFVEMRKKYGNVFGFYEGFRPSIVVNDPDMAREILTKHFDKFYQRPIYTPMSYYPDEFSLLNSCGELWKHQRTVVATAFNKTSMKNVVENINETCKTLMVLLAKENPEGFDIAGYVDRFTLDAFAYSGFNYKVNSLLEPDALLYRYMKSFNASSSTENKLAGLGRIYNGLIPLLKLFDRDHKKVHEEHVQAMRKLVTERRKELAQCDGTSLDTQNDNLLNRIMVGKYSKRDQLGSLTRRKLEDEEVVGHLHSLTGGGLGTLNAVLQFVLHMLCVHPKVQQKTYEEIVEHCGTQSDPDVESLNQLEYLEMVMNETVRLLPVAPGLARVCNDDCEINGVQFKKGMFIRLMAFTLYSDEQYFPEPQKFMPERFLNKDMHPYCFLPFGQGPRMCVGLKYAIQLVKVALVKILQKYTLLPCNKTQDPLPTVLRPMLSPKEGVFLRLVQRREVPLTSHG